jgi:hypothetical protein
MGILMFLTFLVMFMFLALSLDVGLSNSTIVGPRPRSTLLRAAIVFLPADPSDTARVNQATDAARNWLGYNGTSAVVGSSCPISGTGNGVQLSSSWADPNDTRINTVTVCVRRPAPTCSRPCRALEALRECVVQWPGARAAVLINGYGDESNGGRQSDGRRRPSGAWWQGVHHRRRRDLYPLPGGLGNRRKRLPNRCLTSGNPETRGPERRATQRGK